MIHRRPPAAGRARLFGWGRAAFALLPSMLGRFGGLVVIVLGFLTALAFVTGIAGDVIGATRAEIQAWRARAEADTANAEIEKRQREAENLVVATPINRNPAHSGVTLAEIGEASASVFPAYIDPAALPGFLAEFQGIIERAANGDGTLSRAEAVSLTRGPATAQTHELGELFTRYNLPRGAERATIINRSLLLDQLGVSVGNSTSKG